MAELWMTKVEASSSGLAKETRPAMELKKIKGLDKGPATFAEWGLERPGLDMGEKGKGRVIANPLGWFMILLCAARSDSYQPPQLGSPTPSTPTDQLEDLTPRSPSPTSSNGSAASVEFVNPASSPPITSSKATSESTATDATSPGKKTQIARAREILDDVGIPPETLQALGLYGLVM
jgi:hypothetical protein